MRLFGRLSKKSIVLICILLLAGFLRLWQLSKYPVGFTPDEASFGYDAYSILHTGRDQWGHFLPVTLESFGDFKSPLYAYLTVPSVALFGLNEFATRLPNAIFGTLTVLITFLLAGEIGKVSKFDNKKTTLLQIASSLLLAISSWHVMMSRGAFEANLVTFFIPLGIYFFLKATGSPQYTKYYLLSAISIGLSLFTYHSAKMLTPIVLAALVIIFWRKILHGWRNLFFPLTVFLAFFVVLLYSFKIGGGSRIVERSITQGALEEGAATKILLIQNGANPTLAKVLHNKYQVIIKRFVSNYSQYFSSNFLFTKGPAETTYGMIPGIGVLYLFEGIFLVGLIPLLIVKKETRKVVAWTLVWVLVAPIPAALATGVGFAANRAEGMIPAIIILTAMGLIGWNIYLEGRNKKVLPVAAFLVAIIVANSLATAWKAYFVSSPGIAASGMLYGRGEAVKYAGRNLNNYEQIIFSRTLSEPQIYVAFYSKYDPILFQNEAQTWAKYKDQNLSFLDQLGEYRLGKYVFKNIDYKKDSIAQNILLIGKPDEFPGRISVVKEIKYPNGNPDIYIVKP